MVGQVDQPSPRMDVALIPKGVSVACIQGARIGSSPRHFVARENDHVAEPWNDAAIKKLVLRPAPAQGAAEASKLVRCRNEKCLISASFEGQGMR